MKHTTTPSQPSRLPQLPANIKSTLFRNLLVFALGLGLLVGWSIEGMGQIAAWQLNGALGTEVSANASTLNANLNTATLSRGSGVAASALANAFSSTNFSVAGTKATSISDNDYILFTINPKVGYTVSLSTLDVRFRRSSSGPNTFRWQYSIDGTNFTDIGSSDISYILTTTGGDAQSQVSLSGIAALQNVPNTTTITIRLLGWGATATTGTFAIGRSLTSNATDYSLAIGGTVASGGCTPPADPTGSISAAANPACTSTTLTYSGANASIYWQTSATGIDQTKPTTSAYTVASSGTYYVRTYNGSCWSNNALASSAITINPAPSVTTQPTNQSVTSPATATFSVIAANAAGYQWQINTGSGWSNISGATAASYTTGVTATGMTGYQYQCVVSGTAPCSSVTSNAVTLTVSAPGSTCATENFTNIPTTSSTSYLSRSWTGTDGVTWTAEGARTDQTLNGKALCFNTAGTGYVQSPSYPNGIGILTFNYVRGFSSTDARTLQVWVNGSQVGSNITVNASSDVVQNYSQAINISGSVVVKILSIGAGQVIVDDVTWACYAPCSAPTIATQPLTQTVCSTNTVVFSVAATCTSGSLSYQWKKNGADISGATASTYTIASAAAGDAGNYTVVVGCVCGSNPTTTSNVATLTLSGSPPSNPSGSITAAANPACLSTALTYSAPNATIYWQTTASGTSTSRPTTSSYTVSASGTYYVRTYNGTCWSNTALSSPAITIISPATISSQPIDKAVFVGETATFSLTATNATAYQWQINTGSGWTNIGGANSNSYTTGVTTLAMTGYLYRCIITGNAPCTTTTSNQVTLSVSIVNACGLQEFNGGITAPTGWTFSAGLDIYTNVGYYGTNSPALKFDDANYIITAPVSSPQVVSVWLRESATNASGIFKIEGWNGSVWIEIVSLVTRDIVSGIHSYTGVSAYTQFRFTFTGTAGFMAVDDVNVNCFCSSASDAFLIDEHFTGSTTTASIPGTTCGFTATTGNDWIGGGTPYGTAIFNRKGNSLRMVDDGTLTSPTFANADMVCFWAFNSDANPNSDIEVQAYTSGAKGWTTIGTLTDIPQYPQFYYFPLAINVTQVQFVHSYGGSGDIVYFDDVMIREAGHTSSNHKIEKVLVNSCAGSEGTNEIVMVDVGTTNINVSEFMITFPNVTNSGYSFGSECGKNFIANPTYTATLNTTAGCTVIYEPVGGIIPAGSKLFIFTGATPTEPYDFSGACTSGETYYVLYCNNAETDGRFSNDPTDGTQRYVSILDRVTGTYDQVYYDGNITNTNGETAVFDLSSRALSYTNTGCTEVILPVDLIGFEATCHKGVVTLNWSTASETNSDFFSLERSADAKTYEKIAIIKGAGNSNNVMNYSFIDADPLHETSYYRLVQNDYSGHSEMYGPVVSQCSGTSDGTFNLVNITNKGTESTIMYFISSNANVSACVYDMSGRRILCTEHSGEAGYRQLSLDITSGAGLYLFSLTDGNNVLSAKVFIN